MVLKSNNQTCTKFVHPAAPQGGAASRQGWGCGVLTGLCAVFLASAIFGSAASGPALAATDSDEIRFDVPSGQPVMLQDILQDETPGALWMRFRFLAPLITPQETGVAQDQSFEDMAFLCDRFAIPYLEKYALSAERIVISFADQAVEFGVANPQATQFFEIFRPENDRCIWEAF